MTKLSPAPSVQLPVTASSTLVSSSLASSSLARPSQAADPAKLAKSAQDFEAMAIGQLLQPMFDTVDAAHNAFGGGPGEEAWKPMLVQAFARQIEAHGGLGLAKPIYDAMLRMQGTKSQ